MFSLAALTCLGQAACVCPPCAAGGAPAAGGQAAPGAPAAAPGGAAPSGGKATARLVIWDGDANNASPKPGSWASCTKTPKCVSTVAATPGAGVNGTMGIKFTSDGEDWKGFGWNWYGWYPPDSGTDLTQYKSFTFQLKVEAKSADVAPDPSGIKFTLTCSKGPEKDKPKSAEIAIGDYEKGFNDGKWHKIVIPIADLTKGKGAAFDPHTAWELDLGYYSADTRTANFYIDEIAAEP